MGWRAGPCLGISDLNIAQNYFKVVQFWNLMHITNKKKTSFDIFMVVNLQNVFMEQNVYLIIKWLLAKKETRIIVLMFCWLILTHLILMVILLQILFGLEIRQTLCNLSIMLNKCISKHHLKVTLYSFGMIILELHDCRLG